MTSLDKLFGSNPDSDEQEEEEEDAEPTFSKPKHLPSSSLTKPLPQPTTSKSATSTLSASSSSTLSFSPSSSAGASASASGASPANRRSKRLATKELQVPKESPVQRLRTSKALRSPASGTRPQPPHSAPAAPRSRAHASPQKSRRRLVDLLSATTRDGNDDNEEAAETAPKTRSIKPPSRTTKKVSTGNRAYHSEDDEYQPKKRVSTTPRKPRSTQPKSPSSRSKRLILTEQATTELKAQAALFRKLDQREQQTEQRPTRVFTHFDRETLLASPSKSTDEPLPPKTSLVQNLTPLDKLSKYSPAYRNYEAVITSVVGEALPPEEFFSHSSQSS